VSYGTLTTALKASVTDTAYGCVVYVIQYNSRQLKNAQKLKHYRQCSIQPLHGRGSTLVSISVNW